MTFIKNVIEMKISNISYKRFELQLKEPYTIAYETITQAVNFILKIETDTKITGWGCAAPDKIVTHETPGQVEQSIKNTIIPYLTGKSPFRYAYLISNLKNMLGKCSSALAMVDMALFDLISKKAQVPLFELLGGYREKIPTSITIGIMPIEETLKKAADFVQQGFPILKLKGGLEVDEDIEKILRIRDKYPYLILRFDGNRGYSILDSIKFCQATKEAGIEIFEQPAGNEWQLGEITENVSPPVMADESLKSLTDVFRLAKNNRIDMANIKLMKVGGILEGMHINSVAKSAKMEVMVGCLDECALGISAGLHFALSRPNIEFADLDGHLDFTNDPFKGLFHLKNGILRPSDACGLGNISLW